MDIKESNQILMNNLESVKVNSNLPTISISKVLEMIQEPFDSKSVAQKTYNKHFNNPESQYYQKSVDEIIEMWSNKGKESCHYGSLLDDYIGLNLTGTEDDIEMWKLDYDFDNDQRLQDNCESFDKFYAKLNESGNTEYVTREQTVYYQLGDYLFKGRFDCLFRNKETGKWIIIDWKSSGTIDKENKWSKLLGPCSQMDACNYNTYTLQLLFYKLALLTSYLPEGTRPEDIDILLVQMPGKEYNIYKGAFDYNPEFINKVLTFAMKKNILLEKRKNETN